MTDRKRIMVYADERDYQLISELAEFYHCSMSWLQCHLARTHADKNSCVVKPDRKEFAV